MKKNNMSLNEAKAIGTLGIWGMIAIAGSPILGAPILTGTLLHVAIGVGIMQTVNVLALKEKKELEKEYDDIHGKSPADFALRERIDNSQKYIDKVRKMRPIVDKLIPNDDNLLKGYLLGLLVAHNRPTLFSQSNFGHPQTGERVIGFLPVPDSDETTSTILTRLEDGTWANNMTGEIIDRRKVLAWMPLPTVSQR